MHRIDTRRRKVRSQHQKLLKTTLSAVTTGYGCQNVTIIYMYHEVREQRLPWTSRVGSDRNSTVTNVLSEPSNLRSVTNVDLQPDTETLYWFVPVARLGYDPTRPGWMYQEPTLT
jgi:hypothetical protein